MILPGDVDADYLILNDIPTHDTCRYCEAIHIKLSRTRRRGGVHLAMTPPLQLNFFFSVSQTKAFYS